MKDYFKISKQFGFYYENPHQAQKTENNRATLGLMVNDGEKHKITSFKEAFPRY